MTDERTERTFVTPVPARLSLSNINGSVEIMAGSEAGVEGKIEVTAIKHLNTGNAQRTNIRIEQADDGKVTVRTDYNNGTFSWWFSERPCDVDYIVRLPPSCIVQVSGVTNSCSVQGLEGEISLDTVSGPIAVKDLTGKLDLKSVSGKVSGEGLSGSLEYDTVSWRVHLAGSNLSTVRGNTVSGDILLETPLGEGPYHSSSVSGNLRLSLPQASACTILMSSVSGQVKTSLPVTGKWKDGRPHPGGDHHVEVLGGGREIHFNSVSGSLWLESQNETGQVELQAEMEAEKPQPLSHQEILDKIDRGEMTVEQALDQLK